jgi:hypothetical protein
METTFSAALQHVGGAYYSGGSCDPNYEDCGGAGYSLVAEFIGAARL